MATHASGLHSVALAERVLHASVALWHSPPGSVVLYGAAAIHIALDLLAIYQRRTLRIPPLDVLLIALGLAIPSLLIGHAAATRLAFEMYGHLPTYTRIVWNLWNSDNEGRQLRSIGASCDRTIRGPDMRYRSWLSNCIDPADIALTKSIF